MPEMGGCHSLGLCNAEIQAIFDEVNGLEEGEWQASEYEAVPKDMLKEIKAEIKRLNGELKELQKEQKILTTRLTAYGTGSSLTYDIKAKQIEIDKTIAKIKTSIVSNERPILHHTELEKELKECSDLVRAIERRKDELVEQAREKISDAEAKELIIARWLRTLQLTINGYLEIHIRNLQQSIEAMYDKYTVTLSEILKERGIIKKGLNGVKVLGGGTLDKKLTVKANLFSSSAVTKIETAGGKAEVI